MDSNEKYCKNCGEKVSDGNVFCPKCGQKVTDDNEVSNTVPTSIQKEKKTNVCSILAIIFGAIGVIPLLNILFLPVAVILGIIGIATSKNKKKSTTIASIIVVILSLIISFIGLGDILSGKPFNNTEDTKTTQSTPSQTVVEDKYEYISFPETVTTDYFEIHIDGVYTSKEIRPTYTNGRYSYKSAERGKQFCYIKGTIKNTSGNSHQISLLGDYTFDDTYTYDGLLLKDVENGVDNVLMYETISPLEKITFYYACSVPDETVNSYSSAEVTFEVITDLYDSDYNTTKYNKYSLSFGN